MIPGKATIEVTEWDFSRAFDDLTPGVRRAVYMVHSGRVNMLQPDEQWVIRQLYESAKPSLYAAKCAKTFVVRYLDPPEPIIAHVTPQLMAALTKPQTINIAPQLSVELVMPETKKRKSRTGKIKHDDMGRITSFETEER